MRRPRILIADDIASNRALLEAMLSDVDCDIETAADGLDTLAKVKAFHPDLILLDVVMPRLSGFEICRQLKADAANKKIMVLMLTALNEPEDVERAVKAGTDDFISKPVNKIDLFNRVNAMLGANGREPAG